MYVYRADTTTKRSIQNRLNANTFDDFARRQEVALPQCIVPFVFAKQYNTHLDILSTLLAAWNSLSNACALECLPPLEKCIAATCGYLEFVEGITKRLVGAALKEAVKKREMRK